MRFFCQDLARIDSFVAVVHEISKPDVMVSSLLCANIRRFFLFWTQRLLGCCGTFHVLLYPSATTAGEKACTPHVYEFHSGNPPSFLLAIIALVFRCTTTRRLRRFPKLLTRGSRNGSPRGGVMALATLEGCVRSVVAGMRRVIEVAQWTVKGQL